MLSPTQHGDLGTGQNWLYVLFQQMKIPLLAAFCWRVNPIGAGLLFFLFRLNSHGEKPRHFWYPGHSVNMVKFHVFAFFSTSRESNS